MKMVCISASNIAHSQSDSTSLQICKMISTILKRKDILCDIIDLRECLLSPCIGCGKCYQNRNCCNDDAFNEIYSQIIHSDGLIIVSPHYAPIPAKLSMLLEKMEEITFLHWWKDNSYRSEVYGLPTGIISHGGGADWALKSYKAMVNDTIANALDTIQCRVIPFDSEWNTGISLPVSEVIEKDAIFPIQKYDWDLLKLKIQEYIEKILKET